MIHDLPAFWVHPLFKLFGFRCTLRQFCGVYSALAADMKGYAMPLGFWWGDGSKDSRDWCFARLAFKICSVKLRLARGEVILHTLKARSSSQNQRWFLTLKTSNRDGFPGLKDGERNADVFSKIKRPAFLQPLSPTWKGHQNEALEQVPGILGLGQTGGFWRRRHWPTGRRVDWSGCQSSNSSLSEEKHKCLSQGTFLECFIHFLVLRFAHFQSL